MTAGDIVIVDQERGLPPEAKGAVLAEGNIWLALSMSNLEDLGALLTPYYEH